MSAERVDRGRTTRLRPGPFPTALLATAVLGVAAAGARAGEAPPPRAAPEARRPHGAAEAETPAPTRDAQPAVAEPDAEGKSAGAPPAAAEARPRKKRAAHHKGKPAVAGVLNVNRASEAELRLLPGIGKGRAAQIVERRKLHEFASLEDVARIRGLRKLVHRLRAHLAVKGDSTLRPVE